MIPMLAATAHAQRGRISEKEAQLIASKLSTLRSNVTIHLYTSSSNTAKTRRTQTLVDHIRDISSHIRVVRHDMDAEPALKEDLEVDHGPVLALTGDRFQGHSYYGLPSQLELEPFLDGIIIVAGQGAALLPETDRFLGELEKAVHIRVFVTPD